MLKITKKLQLLLMFFIGTKNINSEAAKYYSFCEIAPIMADVLSFLPLDGYDGHEKFKLFLGFQVEIFKNNKAEKFGMPFVGGIIQGEYFLNDYFFGKLGAFIAGGSAENFNEKNCLKINIIFPGVGLFFGWIHEQLTNFGVEAELRWAVVDPYRKLGGNKKRTNPVEFAVGLFYYLRDNIKVRGNCNLFHDIKPLSDSWISKFGQAVSDRIHK